MLGVSFLFLISNNPKSAMAETQESTPLMKIKINKQTYNLGDILIISGNVISSESNRPVTVMILGPDKNLVHIEQILVSKDGTFSVSIKVAGPLWRLPGNYTVLAQGGFKNVASQTTFEFERPDIQSSSVISVQDKQSGQIFNVNYAITGGNVNSISIEPQDIALVLKIDAINQGSIHLQIPRPLLDATSDSNTDVPFLVFIDEGEILLSTDEKSNETYRMITIPFSEGDSEIKIIGTSIVPEFSNMENMVFVIAIASILIFLILVKIKTNYKFSNKLFVNDRNLEML